MGGSPRGPSRRPPGTTKAPKIPPAALVVTATCALLLLLLSWRRAGSLETLTLFGGGGFGGGGAGASGAAAAAGGVPRGGGGGVSQPVTAYGQLLRERGLLPVSGSSDDEDTVAARAECASSYPSITEHLLRGFHLPDLDVDGDGGDDDDGDDGSSDDSAEEEGGEEAVDSDEGEEGGVEGSEKVTERRNAMKKKNAMMMKKKKKKGGGGFVYHRGSASGDVEGVRRDPEPRHASCAVVGSSRVLLGAQQGGEIDSHDAVIRFDDAPTRGFENILGRRTTYRVASPAFVTSLLAGSGSGSGSGSSPGGSSPGSAGFAVKTVVGAGGGAGARLVPGAKALVVGEDTTAEQQRDVQEKIPALLLYPVSLGVTDKVEELYKEFAKRMTALTSAKKTSGSGGAAEEVPVSLIGVFFAMHSCDEVHVYGFPPPGAERHVAEEDYYNTNNAHARGGGGGGGGSRSGSGGKEKSLQAGGGGGGGIGDDVTRLILRVLALEGYIHNHPS